jgi:protein-tyrosine kinase
MSIVEQALKRLQAARAAAAVEQGDSTQQVFGRVVTGPAVSGAVGIDSAPADAAARARMLNIDLEALRSAGLLPPADQERQIAAEYRHIKRPLIDRVFGRGVERAPNGHLIMMASATPGDGKTFTSMNLAMSMALETDVGVLLVDADVAKPHISTILGVRNEPGLLDVLRDESLNVESVILPTNIPRLSILPAGTHSETATELLASERMRHIVSRLASFGPNRIVLLDSPPLMVTTESRALAGVVGQIVFVICAGRTPQRAVFDSLDLLGEGRPIALILNQVDGSQNDGYRYYDYSESSKSPAVADRHKA